MPDLPQELEWVTTVFTDWPGPIAHEYRRLADLMPGPRDGSAAAEYKVLAAFLQLRDFTEVIVKLPTIVMLRDADRLGLDVTRIKGLLLGTPPSLGTWLQVAKDLAKQLRSRKDACTGDLVAMFLDDKKKPTLFTLRLDKLVHWRNQELGHGALRMDLDTLATEMLDTVAGLNRDLASAAERQPWKHLSLRLEGHEHALVGDESIRRNHDRHSRSGHADRDAALICDGAGSRHALNLAPYAAARVCTTAGCNKQDVFFYNRRSGETVARKVQYLDYMMGHALLAPQADDRKWAKEVSDLKGARAGGFVGDKWTENYLLELLESTDLSREYVEPTYLVEDVRDFLATHDRGILWLRAPAHTGKTVFASHVAKMLADEPGDVLVASLLIKREYRFGLGMFEAFIEKTFHEGRTSQYQRKFCWDERGDESMAGCFVQEAAELVERARSLNIAHDRVLLILDGMDELPAPGAYDAQSDVHGIADLLPPADSLPAGMYLLLTSRPDSTNETPAWILDRLRSVTVAQQHARTIDMNRDTDAYRRLLRCCFDDQRTKKTWRAGRIDEPDKLFATIGDRADWTFLYFSHLLRLLRDAVITTADLTHMEERGERLFFAYLDHLESLLGEKEYERVRELLLVLAACEEAHAQAAAIVPPLFFDPQWHGVPLGLLAGLLNEICVDNEPREAVRVPIRLLFVLQSVADILRSYRPDAAHASYRIGLKGLVAAMREDRTAGGWAEQVDNTHLRIAKDAVRLPCDDADGTLATSLETYLLRHGWLHVRAALAIGSESTRHQAAAYVDRFVVHDNLLTSIGNSLSSTMKSRDVICTMSVIIDRRLPSVAAPGCDHTEVAEILGRSYVMRGNARGHFFDYAGAIGDYDEAINLCGRLASPRQRRAPCSSSRVLALAHMNRGCTYAEAEELSLAIADLTRAVRMLERLRTLGTAAFRDEVRGDLSLAYINLGLCRFSRADDHGAIEAYSRAIALLERLRRVRGSRWDPDVCNALSHAYMKRAIVRESRGDHARALRDHNVAIRLKLRLQTLLGSEWSLVMQRELAHAYANRNSSGDADRAVELLTDISTKLGADVPLELLGDLAKVFRIRGDNRRASLRLSHAIRDYGSGIAVYEQMRRKLADRWLSSLGHELAELYAVRADETAELGEHGKAAADYGRAIAVLEEILPQVTALTKCEVLTRIARAHLNRWLMHRNVDSRHIDATDLEKAISTIDKVLMATKKPDECVAELKIAAHSLRGEMHTNAGQYGSALTNYDAAVSVLKRSWQRAGRGWSRKLRHALAKTLTDRALLREKLGDVASAKIDRRRARMLSARRVRKKLK